MSRTSYLILALAIFMFSCADSAGPDNPDGTTGKITTGAFIEAGSSSIGSGGGSVRVTTGSVAGLSIEVPANAYSSAHTISVSAAEIQSHSYGADIHPISHLIRIEAGSDYAALPIKVTVPIQLPAGHFAMGFYYDAETGELEGIPSFALTDNSITLLTSHFSGRHLSDGSHGGITGSKPFVDVVISSIAAGELNGEHASTFVPGIDDWDFTNRGSYISPNGHCAGQSITAMWYYHTKKLASGQPTLFGRFDLADGKIEIDNPRGIRFVSVIQEQQSWPSALSWYNMFETPSTTKLRHDSLHYFTFCYAIKVTKRPQYVGIWNGAVGHAMIVYKAGNNKLHVADPNHPGNTTREIVLLPTGSFAPYMAGANATVPSTPFPNIAYFSKSSFINHAGIESRYNQMLQGTIGSIPPNTFPDTKLQWFNGYEFVDVTDTIDADNDTVIFRALCPTCDIPLPGDLTHITLFDDDEKEVRRMELDGRLIVPINAGLSALNIHIEGETIAGDISYVSFRRVIVRKNTEAMLLFWLGGVVNVDDTVHFGAKDATFTFPGVWNGTTLKINTIKMIYDDHGNPLPATARMTFNFSADMNTITTFDAFLSTVYQGKTVELENLTGRNVPRTLNATDLMIYEVTGTSTCSSITHLDLTNALVKPRDWFCDDDCFIRIRVLK